MVHHADLDRSGSPRPGALRRCRVRARRACRVAAARRGLPAGLAGRQPGRRSALAGWGLVEIFGGLNPANVPIWLFGAVIAHDLVLVPVYSLLAAIATRGLGVASGGSLRVSALNHLRIPAFFSGLLFLVWFPEIL